jgi:hypothetical protein
MLGLELDGRSLQSYPALHSPQDPSCIAALCRIASKAISAYARPMKLCHSQPAA